LDLADRGHEVHFISYAQPFRLDHFRERVFFHEVEMDHYPLFEHPPYSLALAVAIHDAARNQELDLIHVHYAIPHATSAWVAKEMLKGERDLKIVTTLHGTDITLVGLHPSFQAITQFSILKSHGMTSVSQFLKDRTVEDFNVPQERIRVIPNFIDPRIFRRDKEPCHRATLAPDGEKILMHISNFRPVKRIPDVVEVFSRIAREVPSRLVLVGDGPERPRGMEKAAELGVQDKVLFLGKHQSVDELLACADLFLLPSKNESFGLAALEALACGTPVIASNMGGLPEVVTHGETGYLFPLGSTEEMAEAGLSLLKDQEKWTRFSHQARADAVARFSNDVVIPLYEELYQDVLDGRGDLGPGEDEG
jgi:N-acetyl-alpha-D-glucosaminyl L-malate synthase BshA